MYDCTVAETPCCTLVIIKLGYYPAMKLYEQPVFPIFSSLMAFNTQLEDYVGIGRFYSSYEIGNYFQDQWAQL